MSIVLEENVGTQFSNIPGVPQERDSFTLHWHHFWPYVQNNWLKEEERNKKRLFKCSEEFCHGDFFSPEAVSEWAGVGEKDWEPSVIVLSCTVSYSVMIRGIPYPSYRKQCTSGCFLWEISMHAFGCLPSPWKPAKSLWYFQGWVQVSESQPFIFKNKKSANREKIDPNMLLRMCQRTHDVMQKSYFCGNGVQNPNALC